MSRNAIFKAVQDITETFEVRYEPKGQKRPIATVANLALLLLQDPSWVVPPTKNFLESHHIIAYDLSTKEIVKRGSCPWPEQLKGLYTPPPRSPWDETDLALLRGWFELKHGVQVSRQTCKEVISIVAQKNAFDSSGLSFCGGVSTEGALSIDEFLSLDIPEPKKLLGDWLTEESLTLLYALPGVGKTIFTMELCRALCTGTQTGKWKAHSPQKVLYVDGEMGRGTAQKRLTLLKKMGINNHFRFLSKSQLQNPGAPESLPTTIPDIATKAGQDFIEQHIQDAKVVVIDNLSSLQLSGIENEAESWIPIQNWLFSLRSRGLAIILIHHAGKNGTQRGTSRKMDAVNNCIQLTKPEGYQSDQGARIKIHFEKARDAEPGADVADFETALTTDQDGTPVWTWNDSKSAKRESILSLHKEEFSVTEIAKEVGCDKAYVSRTLKKYKESVERASLLTVDLPYKGREVNINTNANAEVNKPVNKPVNNRSTMNQKNIYQQRIAPNAEVNNRSTTHQQPVNDSPESIVDKCVDQPVDYRVDQSTKEEPTVSHFSKKNTQPIDRGENHTAALYGTPAYYRNGYTQDPEEEESAF